MRKLLYVAVAYTAALTFAHYILPASWLLYAALLFLTAGVVRLLLPAKRAKAAICIVCVSAAVGFGWTWLHSSLFIRPADALCDFEGAVHVRITDYATDCGSYSFVPGRLIEEGMPGTNVYIYDYDAGMSDLCPGDEMIMQLKFVSALARNDTYTDSFVSKGIYLRAYLQQEDYSRTGRWNLSFLLFPKTITQAVKEQVLKCFPEDVSAFMTALLTGDKGLLYRDTRLYTNMQLAGISHVVAVSGMHIAFIIGALRLITGRRRRTAFIGIPLVVVFMAMTGFTPSVVRAGVMQILLLLAPILRREYDMPSALAAAALLLLLPNPEAVGSVSLQLSFAAMAGISLFSGRIFRWLWPDEKEKNCTRRKWYALPRSVAGIVSSTLSTLVLTVPIMALWFGFIPLWSVLTNVLCLFAVSAAFVLGYCVCLLGMVWQAAGCAVGNVIAWLPRYILFISGGIARLPYAAIYTKDNYASLWLLFSYTVFIAAWLFKEKDQPFRPVFPICACVIGFLAVDLIFYPMPNRDISVSALNVGQGQSIVLVQNDATVVIDCGGLNFEENAGDSCSVFLHSLGRADIDVLILTHLHADHVNGVRRLLCLMPVDRLVLPREVDDSDSYLALIKQTAAECGTQVYEIDADTEISFGETELKVIAPLGSAGENENGLMVLGNSGEFDFLVTGDANTTTENILVSRYDLPRLELLVVGHHGSKYATGERLLEVTKPETAFISVGVNSFGHPTPEVIERLEGVGTEIYRTDINGNLTIRAGA